ncbi:MAG TPA: hypothetical protein VGL95_03885 [Acetobacteraceae bacterium]|jgi:hypothetical protein
MKRLAAGALVALACALTLSLPEGAGAQNGVTISSLPSASVPLCGEAVPIVQSGTTRRAPACAFGIPYTGTSAPTPLAANQRWLDTSTAPATLRLYDGTQWVATGTLNATGHTFTPAYGTQAQNVVLAGPASGSGAPTWRSLAAGDLPSISSLTGAGTAASENLGVSVADPGTGTLEQMVQASDLTAGARSFALADLFRKWRWGNSGAAMAGTLPSAAALSASVGPWLEIANTDATASITLTAGSGTTISGNTTQTIEPCRDVILFYQVADAAWRARANSTSTLILCTGTLTPGDVVTASTATGKVVDSGIAVTNVEVRGQTPVGDTDYTVLTTDRSVVTAAVLTATRTWTLPLASAVPAGRRFTFSDQGGEIAAATIFIARSGSDTINNSVGISLAQRYAGVILESNGINKWAVLANTQPIQAVAGKYVYYIDPVSGPVLNTVSCGILADSGAACQANTGDSGAKLCLLNDTGCSYTNALAAPHFLGNGTAPTVVSGTGAGASPTVTLAAASDAAFQLSVTTGTSPVVGTIATVTFASAYTAGTCVLSPTNANAAALSAASTPRGSASVTTVWVLTSGATALAAATAYTWNVVCL